MVLRSLWFVHTYIQINNVKILFIKNNVKQLMLRKGVCV